jgi:uncharacterized protein YjbI with pentapeptide repeats
MPESLRRLPPNEWQCDPFDGCFAQKLAGADGCFAHACDSDRAVALDRIRQGGPVDVGAGVQFTQERLAELLKALPHDDADNPILHKANFYCARLPTLDLAGARITGGSRFEGATFQGDARFDGASFQGLACFRHATFQAGAFFTKASFQ